MKINTFKIFVRNSALSLILIGLPLISCNDEEFVDLTSPTAFSPTEFYKTETQIRDGVTGTYAVLRQFYNVEYAHMSEMPSDNTQTVPGNESFVGPLDKLSWTPSFGSIGNLWNAAYRLIARANIVLDQIDGVTFADPTLRERYKGELKFLRALMYFELVRFFGEVPLITKRIASEEEAYKFGRAEVAVVYEQIIRDLIEASAENILPNTYTGTNVGRATRGAALSLLGKVYLYQKNYSAAASTLKRVIDLNVYTLLPTYANVFLVSNNNNAEIIFAAQFTGGTNGEGSGFYNSFVPQGVPVAFGSPGGNHLGTKDLFDAYSAADLRKTTAIRSIVSSPTLTFYYTNKFFEVPATSEGSQDWPVIRYSDVLLMYAEALNEDRRTAEALLPASDANGSINKVRRRAGLPELANTLTYDELAQAIDVERRLELAFEGHRWFDLIRRNRFIPVLKQFKTKYNEVNIQIDDNSGYKALYPIPFRENQLNPTGLYQNPNYN